jgi:hypothetical protein
MHSLAKYNHEQEHSAFFSAAPAAPQEETKHLRGKNWSTRELQARIVHSFREGRGVVVAKGLFEQHQKCHWYDLVDRCRADNNDVTEQPRHM